MSVTYKIHINNEAFRRWDLNVSNTNHVHVLTALGYEHIPPFGSLDPVELLKRITAVHRMIKSGHSKEFTRSEEIVADGEFIHIVRCGVSVDYMKDKLIRLTLMAAEAIDNEAQIVFA